MCLKSVAHEGPVGKANFIWDRLLSFIRKTSVLISKKMPCFHWWGFGSFFFYWDNILFCFFSPLYWDKKWLLFFLDWGKHVSVTLRRGCIKQFEPHPGLNLFIRGSNLWLKTSEGMLLTTRGT